jgi:bacillithiol system protein YtxJ
MGFTSFLSNKKEDKWNNLTTNEDLVKINNDSYNQPQIIFKHSTRCSISQMAKNRMIEGLDQLIDKAAVYYLDLLNYRNISNEIANKWGVEHESPQIIVIKNGEAIYHSSHNMIKVTDIKEHL